jgi:hypothetical protein
VTGIKEKNFREILILMLKISFSYFIMFVYLNHVGYKQLMFEKVLIYFEIHLSGRCNPAEYHLLFYCYY